MAVDNKQIATDVLELVGGAENVTVATNCMTRLRLTLLDYHFHCNSLRTQRNALR